MKKIKFLGLCLLTMFVSMNVNALDVEDLAELKECLAGSETTCTVTKEISLVGTSSDTVNETLALNGKTVVLEETMFVNEYATLTINGNGKVEGQVDTGLINTKNGGTLIVNGGEFKNTAGGAKCFGVYGTETDTGVKTTLTIAEGVKLSANYGILVGRAGSSKASFGVVVNYAGDFQGITGNNGYNSGTIGVSTNGYIQEKTGNIPVINITGGSIKSVEGTTGTINKDDAPAIYAAGYAKWNISGGNIEGSEALSIKAGDFEVTGGTLKAFGTYADPASPYNDGSEATGAAISITANDGYAKAVKLSVKEAIVESENGHAVYEGLTTASQTTALAENGLNLEGGSYTGKDEALKVNNVTGFVTGGTYSSDVTEYVKESYVANKNGENYVVEKVKPTTEIPTVDPEEEVEEVTIGVKDDDNTVEQVLIDSIEEDSELSEKIKDKNVNVAIEVSEVKEEELSEETKEAILEKAGDATIAEYFDISIVVRNTKDNSEIDVVSDLTEEIELMILLPENLKNNNKEVNREYFVIREHGDAVDKINAQLSEDGNYLVFKSKNFSTYALAYQDVKNPQTGDSIMLYVVLGFVSLVGVILYTKKRCFN